MAKGATPTQIKQILKDERARVKKRNGGGGGNGSGRTLENTLRRSGRTTSRVAGAYAVSNPAITILTGRNLLHPLGGLGDGSVAGTSHTVGPLATARPMVDTIKLAFDETYRAGIGYPVANTQLQGAVDAVKFNFSSSLGTPEGRATTWGAAIVGGLVSFAAPPVLDGIANVLGEAKSAMRRR